jgi:hypothetical protein
MDVFILSVFTALLLLYNRRILRTPVAGFVFWMLFLIINDVLNLNPTTKLGGFNIMLQDIMFGYFMYASVICLRRSDKPDNDTTLKWFLAMLLFIVLAIPVFALFKGQSIESSINASRGFILFLPAFVYFYSFNYTKTETTKIINLFTSVAIILSVAVFVFQVASSERVVPSSGALFFAFSAVLLYTRFIEKGKAFDLISSLFLIMLVIFLRHRSVWIALGMSLVFVHIYIKLAPRILAVILVTIVGLIGAAVIFPSRATQLFEVISESASPFRSADDFEHSTGGGRVARWTAQIENKFEWPVLVWGLGPGYDRAVYMRLPNGEKRLSTASFHNHYLEQLFRIGGVSLLILFAFIYKVFRCNHQQQMNQREYEFLALSACIFGTLGFGMMYSFTFLMFIFLGFTYSLLNTRHEEDHSDNTDVQPVQRARKFALDAWKYEHTQRVQS